MIVVVIMKDKVSIHRILQGIAHLQVLIYVTKDDSFANMQFLSFRNNYISRNQLIILVTLHFAF